MELSFQSKRVQFALILGVQPEEEPELTVVSNAGGDFEVAPADEPAYYEDDQFGFQGGVRRG